MGGELISYLSATLPIFGGVAVVLCRSPVNAPLCMILSRVSLASLFRTLDAFFLAALQVLVYAGAVMVLFLFVIMLLDVDQRSRTQPKLFVTVVGLLVTAVAVFVMLGLAGVGSIAPPEVGTAPTSENPVAFAKGAKAFGYALLTKYMLPVQIVGFLLLVAMVGVILLARSGKTGSTESEGDA